MIIWLSLLSIFLWRSWDWMFISLEILLCARARTDTTSQEKISTFISKTFLYISPRVLIFQFLWAIAALYSFTRNGSQDEKKKLYMKSRRLVALSGFSPLQQQTRFSLSGKLFLIYITGLTTGTHRTTLRVKIWINFNMVRRLNHKLSFQMRLSLWDVYWAPLCWCSPAPLQPANDADINVSSSARRGWSQ